MNLSTHLKKAFEKGMEVNIYFDEEKNCCRVAVMKKIKNELELRESAFEIPKYSERILSNHIYELRLAIERIEK